jgi:peptide/nickel transport system permease protein
MRIRSVLIKRILQQKSGLFGGLLILAFLGMAFAPMLFSPFDPLETHKAFRLEPPNSQFWFGTDELGRDILSRIIWGCRISLTTSFFTVVVANFFGTFLGLVSGYYGGFRDNVIMRLMDILFSFPFVILAILIIAITGSGAVTVILCLSVAYLPYSARVARGAVLSVKEIQYVEAAKAAGATDLRIILKHILPNIAATLIVMITMNFAFVLLAESALQFLGFGVAPPAPSWGLMLKESRRFLELAPWTAIFPGLAIALAVVGFNLMGDGLRDFLDPKMRD